MNHRKINPSVAKSITGKSTYPLPNESPENQPIRCQINHRKINPSVAKLITGKSTHPLPN
jgi:hypothetical protein